MSLDYDLRAIEGMDALRAADDAWRAERGLGDDVPGPEWQTTEYLIFATMAVGLGEIDASGRFWARLSAYEALCVPLAPHTAAQVARRVGLRTNVSPMTDAKWRAHVMGLRFSQAASEWSGAWDAEAAAREVRAGVPL